WYAPPVVFARNDGNLTHMEVLLGMGQMQGVVKVIVNDIEIPVGQSGKNMTATGWYNIVTLGTQNGAFNLDFTDASGNPLGDPYGSMAVVSVVVPNRISDGGSLPIVQVLAQGIQLTRYNADGTLLDRTFTNNPAWALLDVLRRSGWTLDEINLASFAATAAVCDQLIPATDLNGNATSVPQWQCNLVLSSRRSAADVVRGIRNASALYLTYGAGGMLQLNAENTIAAQQPAQSPGTNSTGQLDGGWPMYEFSDGSAAFSGILRKDNGEPWIRLWSRSSANTPNQYTVEFQDEFNEYQQDSMSLADVDDVNLLGQEITSSLMALGLPNFNQASRIMALTLNRSILGNTFVEFQTSVRGVGLLPGDIITVTYLKEGLDRQPFRIVRIAPDANYRTAQITGQWHDDSWYTSSVVGNSGGRRQSDAGLGVPRPLVGTTLDTNGNQQFGITETSAQSADGSFTVSLSTAFVAPNKPGASTAGIPLLSLSPQVQPAGGALKGGQTLYYALSAVDSNGAESALSFSVGAAIPSGTDTNTVTLKNLSFSPNAVSFNVYRGPNPSELLQLAANAAVASSFTDTGASAPQLQGPPDPNYDHANFYWRMEQQPAETATISSPFTIGNTTLEMLANEYQGAVVRILQGAGSGQERIAAGNTSNTLTLTSRWDILPDSTSSFVVADATWQFGAIATASPVVFDIPNRNGATVHVSGRSANSQNQESAYALAPLTRWQIGGATGTAVDADVPPAPFFGLAPMGQGTIELAGVSFGSLTDTRTISAGTLTLWYWDETTSPSTFTLAAAIAAADTTLTLSAAGPAQPGDVIQIDAETVIVQSAANGGLNYTVTRASHGSTAADHSAGASIYHLTKKVLIVPFVNDFFGSPASGSYAFPIFLPDARIAAAELFMTNSQGPGS
ncbi:MAG: phage tail protein, partial [Bryobacteraceae bacterium]